MSAATSCRMGMDGFFHTVVKAACAWASASDGRKATPYDEDDAPNPQGVYARSKWEGDQRVREVLDQHLILRVSWVFSARRYSSTACEGTPAARAER